MVKYFHKKVISIPIYSGKLVLLFTNDTDKIKKYLPDFDDEIPYASTYYKDNENTKEDETFIILNFKHSNKLVTLSVLAHEGIHATNFILSDRGVIADFDNDEVVAYLLDFVVNEICLFAKKMKIKIEYAY